MKITKLEAKPASGIEVPECSCPQKGWCERHQRMKGSQAFRYCKNLPDHRYLLDQYAKNKGTKVGDNLRSRKLSIPVPPKLYRMVVSLTKALFGFFRSGMKFVPDIVYNQRIKRCAGCPHQKKKFGQSYCGLCGCLLFLKARFPNERCPELLPLWREYTPVGATTVKTEAQRVQVSVLNSNGVGGCGCSAEGNPPKRAINPYAPFLLLTSNLAPGDIVTMTAAVRELANQYPDRYQIDVRTTAQELWSYNPYITPSKGVKDIRVIEMHYNEHPYVTVNRSNEHPFHFIEGYCAHLAMELKLENGLRPREFRGDIHLSVEEKKPPIDWDLPEKYWLVNAGTKRDFTVKQWPIEYFQEVVNHFKGRLTFVQVGGSEFNHDHPRLKNVIDMVGKTGHRELIRMVHHSQGALSGITYLVHLASAVPLPRQRAWAENGQRRLRPAVVVFGGREPPTWSVYPGQLALHSIGALPCCQHGGCWKSRTVPLKDGDSKDSPDQLCKRPVQLSSGYYPECMKMIEPIEAIRAIERYITYA